jgi:uncharacterized protein YgbK (DUF1537 family)
VGLRLLVVADDITGAHDCAARLASLGAPVPTARQVEHLRHSPGALALVLDVETRYLTPSQARWRSAQAWSQLGQAAAAPWRFQKLDSTLRGNPGEDVEGMAQASAAPWVAVLPAYPRAGRLTQGGRHSVHGVALERSEFARDPLSPARAGRPQDLFRASQRLHVPWAWVRGGSGRLGRELRASFKRRQARFVTFDCVSDADVDSIARACVGLGCRHFAGASALAGSLASLAGAGPSPRALPPKGLPWMVLAGSISQHSLDQLRLAQAQGALQWAALDAGTPLSALKLRRRRGTLALSTVSQRPALRAGAAAEAGEKAIRALVSTALKLWPSTAEAAWFLTGGHSALRFFEAAGYVRFDVSGEALPGLALGYASGDSGGAWAASKPGAFGQMDLYPRFLELVQAR